MPPRNTGGGNGWRTYTRTKSAPRRNAIRHPESSYPQGWMDSEGHAVCQAARTPHHAAMKPAMATVFFFSAGRWARSSKACAPSPAGP